MIMEEWPTEPVFHDRGILFIALMKRIT